ncbi:DUF5694 domain-containing protein [Sphingomicrobium aestuariivivum]|uniref:DUF5694 domain-containing protein n=1 Tax=Sphingomicrobium aestuariivivum TaxID=1582356 RepID=UPI001FD6CAAC|nr:DUF5694 domain-containing protein [Sphingomicrobium aestuariivivum]MCJ8190159.1 DUF5694 domain-containing protein [Sphingomicrobium aestuariivivum]
MMLTIAAMAAALAHPAAPEAQDGDVEVMVLGMYHLANPGLDMINVDAGDVLEPQAQAELAALNASLATWQPTKILVEDMSDAGDLSIADYRDNAEKRIAEERSETYQVGYRLGQMLGHADIYGFDEQPTGDEPAYFPMGPVQAWVEANDKQGEFGALLGWAQAFIEGEMAKTADCTIAEKLLMHNDSALMRQGHEKLYYGFLDYGDGTDQPGAELNAYWYMRNAKMFGKAMLVVEPGDRVLIIVGSGHKYWLDHFVDAMPGYRGVDATPYLLAAEGNRCQ